MEKDYYVDEKGLAMFYEIHWLDKLRELGNTTTLESKARLVSDDFIVTKHFSDVAQSINSSLKSNNSKPQSLLEVGSALGRTSYEMIVSNPSIDFVTAIEPSKAFIQGYEDILIKGKKVVFKYIKSRKQVGEFEFDASAIARDCEDVKFALINKEFDNETTKQQFDLAICLNVLDQCPSPKTIVDALKHRVKAGGVLCLSCTYQWNKKHLLDFSEAVDDINEYFKQDDWKKLADYEHEYKFRFSERYAHVFLAHMVIYQKN